MKKIKHAKCYALLSVYDKTGIVEFAKVLEDSGYAIISTGGTAKLLNENGIEVVPIQEVTGNPESFDGRMKTISFQVESGILFDRSNKNHIKEAKDLHIKPIDIVVCNLYPFTQVITEKNVSLETAIENIDVGGPTMIRSAAKNFQNVLVVTSPTDYQEVTEALTTKSITEKLRKKLAAKAFALLSWYDSQVAHYFSENPFPKHYTIAGRKILDLRYGENPHQKAAMYIQNPTNAPLQNLTQVAGRGLSLTNLADINAGIEIGRLFSDTSAVVIKHNSPCGIALGKDATESLKRAIEADPVSAFGGVIVLNKKMDLQTAKVITSFKDERRGNIDIVASPAIAKEAAALLSQTRKTMGIYTFGELPKKREPAIQIKWIDGGFIVQSADDNIDESFADWKIVTKKKPTKKQMEQMKVAWKFISRIRSNAVIVVDKSLPMTRGIGSGQTSRVASTNIALKQAGSHVIGSILASDSFFPFPDSVEFAAKAGVAAIIQQGGSINDKASIQAAEKAGIPMVFTGRRAFWH